ncbi:Disks Large-like 4 [Manis pentadactyla]|nr:Disks Large-like 4 [Manis pentadactyla]
MDCLCIVTTKQNQGKCQAQNCSVEAPAWMPVHHCTIAVKQTQTSSSALDLNAVAVHIPVTDISRDGRLFQVNYSTLKTSYSTPAP